MVMDAVTCSAVGSAFEVVADKAQQCLSLHVILVLETLRLSFHGIKLLIGKQVEK